MMRFEEPSGYLPNEMSVFCVPYINWSIVVNEPLADFCDKVTVSPSLLSLKPK